MSTVEKQIMSEDTVDALTLDVPSGSHAHSFDGGLAKTLIGGNHAHVFILPSGDQIREAARAAGLAYVAIPITHGGFSMNQVEAMQNPRL